VVAIAAPFGAVNRNRRIDEYFDGAGLVTPENAWVHVYRLLMWIDSSIGLAHCYESDKCQPGKNWYSRALAFHKWVCGAMGVEASQLKDEIDLLFRWVIEDLALGAEAEFRKKQETAKIQRGPYEGLGFPQPGRDPELESIILGRMASHLSTPPSAEALQGLTQAIRAYIGQENKRKNLLGEGFEDVMAAVLRRTPGVAERLEVFTRKPLHELPGFRRPAGADKVNRVDLAMVDKVTGHRTLVTLKWSVRADREKQFLTDYDDYWRLNDTRKPFDYVYLTNEFDPARIAAACDNLAQNSYLFKNVVHVNLDGPWAAYDAPTRGQVATRRGGTVGDEKARAEILQRRNDDDDETKRGIERARQSAAAGRVISLDAWLRSLGGHGPAHS
jgi:hypothetical protein